MLRRELSVFFIVIRALLASVGSVLTTGGGVVSGVRVWFRKSKASVIVTVSSIVRDSSIVYST